MTICPNCGAGNKPGSSVCRMCGASLQEIKPVRDSHADDHDLPPTIVVSEQQLNQQSGGSNGPQGIVCPKCQTLNEVGWSFCQQCGNRLAQPPSPEPHPPVTPPPAIEPKSREGFKTVPSETPTVENKDAQGLKTVVAKPAEPKLEDKTERPVSSVAPASEPPVPRQPSAPKQPDPQVGLPTVVAEPPVIKPSLPKNQKPEAPAQKSSPPTEQVRSITPSGGGGENFCPQCGQPNNPGNAFCGSCGSVISVAKTVVMSSAVAPVKGRLHLVMEGGQSGETYEIDEETIIGRASGDITFPHDGFMSGRHARIVRRGNTFTLTDEGSRNGTFIKIKGEVELKPGDMILVGKQLFRFEV